MFLLKILVSIAFLFCAVVFLSFVACAFRNRDKVNEIEEGPRFWRGWVAFNLVSITSLLLGSVLIWCSWPLAALCAWPFAYLVIANLCLGRAGPRRNGRPWG